MIVYWSKLLIVTKLSFNLNSIKAASRNRSLVWVFFTSIPLSLYVFYVVSCSTFGGAYSCLFYHFLAIYILFAFGPHTNDNWTVQRIRLTGCLSAVGQGNQCCYFKKYTKKWKQLKRSADANISILILWMNKQHFKVLKTKIWRRMQSVSKGKPCVCV
jgi:hypothetical protein